MNTISRLLLLLFATMCCAVDANSSTNDSVLTLKIDDEHNFLHFSHPETPRRVYTVKGSAKLFIDATDYGFAMPAKAHGKPVNELWLIHLDDLCMYRSPWQQGKSRYELSRATLEPFDRVLPFEGLKAGQIWLLLIIRPGEEPNKGCTVWQGRIEVR